MSNSRLTAATAVVAASFLILSGCASKKYVRTKVDPLEGRVGGLESKSKQQAGEIEQLERGVSRADERAATADTKAAAAAREAAKAAELAGQGIDQAKEAKGLAGDASRAAGDARTFADQGLRGVDRKIDLLDNFKLVSTETVLFGFGSTRLTEEAQARLDATAASLANRRRFIVEVQGFTDKTGPVEANLELSRKRASEVVRYLTVKHKVALHRIHLLGLGAEAPAADNDTPAGRKQNRRVEVKLYEADLSAATPSAVANSR